MGLRNQQIIFDAVIPFLQYTLLKNIIGMKI
ncbi:Uncharacterised protein [Staphylococcus saprophyticus]|nr:Uncharacterised protein [Staphylococcus saprophyticus]SUM91319.1 Uncharacterised protein [Staphylococcus saprophyticus]VDZ25125.1 Uncharacterised protein [Staphylococcus saprophyticus]